MAKRKNTRSVHVTVTVPKKLRQDMDTFQKKNSKINWSKIVCEAIKNAIKPRSRTKKEPLFTYKEYQEKYKERGLDDWIESITKGEEEAQKSQRHKAEVEDAIRQAEESGEKG